MKRQDFYDKLATGNKYEFDYGSCYTVQGYNVCFNNDKNYDIKISKEDNNKTFELKKDLKSEYSHNYGIETNQGYDCRKSGISTTKSDYWVIYSHQQYHVWHTCDVKHYVMDICSDTSWGIDACVTGGDNYNRLSLVNRNKMLRQLPPITIIPMTNEKLIAQENKNKNKW